MEPPVLEFIGAVVILVACAIVALRAEKSTGRKPAVRASALALVAVSTALGGFVAWRVIEPPPALVSGPAKVGEGIDVPAHDGALQLLVHGELSSLGKVGTYQVQAMDGARVVESFAGDFDRTSSTRRVTRRVVTRVESTHLERRHDLAPSAALLRLVVGRVSDTVTGPLILSVLPQPPREMLILGVGSLVTLGAALIDRRSRGKSFLAGPVAVPCVLALLLLEAPRPLEVAYFLRMVPVAGLLGLVAAGVFTLLAKVAPSGKVEAPVSAS